VSAPRFDADSADGARVRVVLIDDHPAMRAAFRMILEASGFDVIGEAGDGDAAIALVTAEQPDVALMDVRMPGRDGISATEEIVAGAARTAVLVLTTFDDDEILFGALGAGAAGFLVKNAAPEEIVDAVRRVAAGDAVLDRSVARRVFARFAPTSGVQPSTQGWGEIERLTERERDVLWLMAQGMTNQEVADRLGVGEATTKTHVSRALLKLGVRDRVQAVIVAHSTGFASTPRSLS
jgi:DNA-binding NarL/FixJ family response regulator